MNLYLVHVYQGHRSKVKVIFRKWTKVYLIVSIKWNMDRNRSKRRFSLVDCFIRSRYIRD